MWTIKVKWGPAQRGDRRDGHSGWGKAETISSGRTRKHRHSRLRTAMK